MFSQCKAIFKTDVHDVQSASSFIAQFITACGPAVFIIKLLICMVLLRQISLYTCTGMVNTLILIQKCTTVYTLIQYW